MFTRALKHTIGTKNDRELKKLLPIVDEINRIEETYRKLTDEQLRAKTEEFRERIRRNVEASGERMEELRRQLDEAVSDDERKKVRGRIKELWNEILDPLLPEAYAAVKNACRRLMGQSWMVCDQPLTWEMIPFDVQLIGAIALHQGTIAEMSTGEGKTLVATMPLYLNALTGNNVHLVTVNDYLARRDGQWMGKVFETLGLTVGCLQHDMDHEKKIEAYRHDITYGTNSEFGFDYLRDNGMALRKEDQVQRGHFYAIIDEVDSILVDEARTPLIISGPVSVSTQKYDVLRPAVEEIVKKQTLLCNRLLKEAASDLDAGGDEMKAGKKIWLVKEGSPKNRKLLKMMEDPKIRKLLERVEADLHTDTRKEEMHALREDLFFYIGEKTNEADLSNKGIDALPKHLSEDYRMPNLIEEIQKVDEDEGLTPEEKEKKKHQVQERFNRQAENVHNVSQLLRAFSLFEKDVDYVVEGHKVMIVDEFTGRLMPGRRYSDGLHQALEAKERVKIEQETQTFATITLQNYFRIYEKLAGMTGTAETEASEFSEIYSLDVLVVPTNEPVRRSNYNDVIYKTRREKSAAVVEEIAELYRKKRPVLVGTIDVHYSEVLGRMLKRKGVIHSVLNAKYHQQEAEIVARAGQPGAVTIATNMAGRGTDIKLGTGVVNEECLAAERAQIRKSGNGHKVPWCCVTCPVYGKCRRGSKALCGKSRQMFECRKETPCGLHIIGTERHEARRIDRQLRGRCARQGDPGSSRFYISLEDELMRLFGSERIAGIMDRVGLEEGQELVHPLLSKSIENAQKRVEGRNFSIRKRTLEYDDVMNKQREVVYAIRDDVLSSGDTKSLVVDHILQLLDERLPAFLPPDAHPEDWDFEPFLAWLAMTFPCRFGAADLEDSESLEDIQEKIMDGVKQVYEMKESYEGGDNMRMLERYVMLGTIDRLWKEHLYNMDGLREGIGLRAYGQRDPLIEYKKESFEMFSEMISHLNEDIAVSIFRSTASPERLRELEQEVPQKYEHAAVSAFSATHPETTGVEAPSGAPPGGAGYVPAPIRREGKKVGRNEPCPCGSGKKYKKCCGINA